MLTTLPLRWQGTPDGRSRGKAVQFVRDYLAARPEGATREQIDQATRSHFGERFSSARRSLQGVIYRLRTAGELEERDGLVLARRLSRTAKGRNG